jgi:hypothetical protein
MFLKLQCRFFCTSTITEKYFITFGIDEERYTDYNCIPKYEGSWHICMRDEGAGGWRKLYTEELHNLYSSPKRIRMIKSRKMKWARHIARMRKKRIAYRILVGKPEGKRLLRRPRLRRADNIKIDLRVLEWGWYGLDRSGLG